MKNLIKYSGVALIMAGLSFVVTNAGVAPFVNFEASFRETLVSPIFLYRMIFAALTALFLLFGSIGLYLHHVHIDRGRSLRLVAFLLAFLGSAFLLSNEWHQIFVLPEIARLSPEAIDRLDASDQIGGYLIGAIFALATFSFGWIFFLISVMITKNVKPLGPALAIAGFFIIPLVSGIFSPVWGGVIGSISLGSGFVLIGSELVKES
jgi:hypothetical protein